MAGDLEIAGRPARSACQEAPTAGSVTSIDSTTQLVAADDAVVGALALRAAEADDQLVAARARAAAPGPTRRRSRSSGAARGRAPTRARRPRTASPSPRSRSRSSGTRGRPGAGGRPGRGRPTTGRPSAWRSAAATIAWAHGQLVHSGSPSPPSSWWSSSTSRATVTSTAGLRPSPTSKLSPSIP